MKKEITITLAILALLVIGLNITDLAASDSETFGVSVIRSPPMFGTGGTTYNLNIVSSENIVAIKESFIPEDCEVILTVPSTPIDIFEFNENENTWIIADKAESFSLDMIYVIPSDCELDEAAGEVLVLSEDGDISSVTFGLEEDPADLPAPSGSPSSGSGGGGTTPTVRTIPGTYSQPITQAETAEEFEGLIETAARNILGAEKSDNVMFGSLMIVISLIVVVLIIASFIAYTFLRKPKQFKQQA
jgi:hypothetical protein